ncbi:LptF/LptG family permease, partial [Klebsiella pneumoniae]|nr:LptF/LptG family permease [Klebsiella pneumoniae]
MDRYILREMLGPFLFGVGAFTSVGLSIGVVFELVRQVTEAGLPLSVAAQVFLLKMPDFLVLAFPM